MSKSNGKLWPYIIGGSITLVFGFCVATIVVASTLPVEKSDTYMMGYQEADASANEIISARIAFDKQYNIEYLTPKISSSATKLEYKLTDKSNNPVNNAKLVAVITRPNSHKYDMELQNPEVHNGVYTFKEVSLPKEGRWDIMLKAQVDEFHRFYNLKTDTRDTKVVQY